MVNSQRKGASAEREVAGLIFQNTGVRLKRNLEQARGGGHDLVPDGEGQHWPLAVEIKNYAEALPGSITAWWRQTVTQAELVNLIPVLWYKSRRRWRVMLPGYVVLQDAPWGDIEAYTITITPEMFFAIYREILLEKLPNETEKIQLPGPANEYSRHSE